MTTREEIIAHLKSPKYNPLKTRGLSRFFDIQEADYTQFRSLVKEMIRDGQIVEGQGGKLRAAGLEKIPAGMFTGTIRISARGFGFIEPEDPKIKDDVFVPPGDTLDAISGDRVMARLVKRHYVKPGQGEFTGRVVEVVTRGQTRFVGTYRLHGKRGFIKPDGGLLLIEDIPVPDATSSGARPNDKVVFELLTYPAAGQQAEAVIVEVLGARGAPGVDILTVIRQFDLPDVFPAEVLEMARQAAQRFTAEEISRRTDLRDELTITIDPDDARDYDDAVSVQQLERGITRLGVHIADVSFFVRPGEALDVEAHRRGTSVYLPTKVLPMLPELLSNGMCSLQEGQDRLTESAFIDLDGDARVVATHFARSVIRNKKRLTYGQVNEVLDQGRTDLVTPEVLQLLQRMDALARRILRRRRGQGYLELDLPDVELVFDENGQVTDAVPEDNSFSHKIIEMLMVEANEAVARRLRDTSQPFMRRIHETPDQDRSDELGRFLRSLGQSIQNPHDRLALQKLLKETRGTPASYPLHLAVLRSMMQAVYSLEEAGHWALGSDCYCHFTSPIRRYPDLTVHRSLAALEGWDFPHPRRGGRHKGESGGPAPAGEGVLREMAAHCSRTERRAEAAERELTKVKVLTLLEKHVGDEHQGVVSSVADYGLFVELPKYMIEGLVHISDLRDDSYVFDRRSYALIGRHSSRRIQIGDTIHVVIAAVDIPRRQLDLSPVAVEARPAAAPVGQAKTKKSAKADQRREKKASKGRRRKQ